MGETDRVFTLLTSDRGKIRAIAKGARRPTSKLAPSLDYFNRCRVMLSRGRDLDVITSVEVIERREALGERVNAFSHACHLSEVTGRLVPDGQDVPEVYQLLSAALTELEQPGDPWVLARWYEMAILAVTGYRLELYRCASCGNELLAEPNMLGHPDWRGALPELLAGRSEWPSDVGERPEDSALARSERYGRSADGLRSSRRWRPRSKATLAIYMRSIAERDFSSLRVLREIRETTPYFDV